MGTSAGTNQGLVKFNQEILSLRAELKHTKQLLSDLADLLDRAIATDAILKEVAE